MSVSVDKYFGWTIDLKTDLNCNDFDFYHKFIDKHPNLDQWKNCMPRIFLKNLIQFIRNLQGKNYKKKKSN